MFYFLALAVLVGCQQVEKPNVAVQLLNQGWTLTGDTLDINMQVDVPSVVQQSLYDNGLIPHPYLGTVENQLLWISDHPWDYTLRFDADRDLLGKENVELKFEGIVPYDGVNLNGEKRAWPEIMVSRLRVNLFGDPICAALARHCLSSTDLRKCPFKELAVYAKESCSSKNTNTEDTDHLLFLLSKLFITYA